MRVTAIGVKSMSGIGKTSGRPFDFAQISILRPIEPMASEKFTINGFGFEISDLDLDKTALHQFNGLKFPLVCDLVVDTVPGRNGLRSVVVGIQKAA